MRLHQRSPKSTQNSITKVRLCTFIYHKSVGVQNLGMKCLKHKIFNELLVWHNFPPTMSVKAIERSLID